MINLSTEFHPVPRPLPKGKKVQHPIKPGKKTQNWDEGRADLKKKFQGWGITVCEIKLEGCVKDNFLGFAHTERRQHLTPEDVKNPNKVVLACQPCHQTVDFEMGRKESKKLLESIIEDRNIQNPQN